MILLLGREHGVFFFVRLALHIIPPSHGETSYSAWTMGRITKKVNNLRGYRELWKHYTLSWVYKPKNVFYGSSLTKLQPSWSLFNLQKVKVHVGIVMTGFAQLSAHGGLCSSPPAVSLRNAFLRQVLSASF